MTRQQACRILGISTDASGQEIKKRYRKLMMQVHPDVHHTVRERYPYNAKDINMAYSYLKETMDVQESLSRQNAEQSSEKEKKAAAWDAPVNPQAYMEREIYQYAEDIDGAIIGHFSIARGKFLWKTEEDFPLFLKSIYQCGNKLLNDIDDALDRKISADLRMIIQAELTYLLAQQFIHCTELLKELTKKQWMAEDGAVIFKIPSMLETSKRIRPLQFQEILYPAGIQRHRLYLKDRNGQKLGYLSFHDDRLYYVVIPLLEQRSVMVRIEAAVTNKNSGSESVQNQNLYLWLKVPKVTAGSMPENINLKIESVLSTYRNYS